MSLALEAANALARKHDAQLTVSRDHQLALRKLRCITDFYGKTDLTFLLNTRFVANDSPPITAEEDEFLKANDLQSGKHYQDSTLPYPPPLSHDTAIYASRPQRTPKQPSPTPQASPSANGLATEAALTQLTDDADSMAAATVQTSIDVNANALDSLTVSATKLEQAAKPDGASVTPEAVAPPAAEEEANFSAATKELLDLESPQRPAKTVHLPPEDVQEERFRERKEVAEEDRRRSQSDKAAQANHLQAQADLASSPSSTVGALSTATPMPPQDSPDTSPDSERAAEEVLPPKDLRPTPEEQQAKEEHDRLLAAQKEIARQEALGGPTPDDQLNWEAREAAAREEEETEAREAINGPEADASNGLKETEAEQSMGDVQTEPRTQLPITPAASHDEKAAPQAADSSQAEQRGDLEDEDNITVTPRMKPPPIDTGRQRSSGAMAAPPRMTTRVSSGAMSRRSVSEIIGESPAQPSATPRSSRQVSSPEPVSPMTARHPQDTAVIPPAVPLSTPRRAPQLVTQSTPSNHDGSSLVELATLKGAAEDPERDYLEPLFRIQAHDSQNSSTRALPDLVKQAHKNLSTDDHFTTLHERMDYRILRRIYQLQNANKWSLRQMERAKEPEQPVTHMDHMMAEMKWMQKDFRAERKMKKSVCAWLAARCAEWVAGGAEERRAMQVKVRPPKAKANVVDNEQPPDLEMSGESAPEDDLAPSTPRDESSMLMSLVVAPELSAVVCNLQKVGKLGKALQSLPVVGLEEHLRNQKRPPLTAVSKFVEGKILPRVHGAQRKRSRYDYDDDAELLDEPDSKRLHVDRDQPPEEQDVALFHPDNKPIRERLHANNAFRPPSEFVMPATTFYEFRNGSQWIWEDDQKLRKLAKEYSFNWSLIADEVSLLSRYRSSAERRTPWECFERWVELESLPADMRKTMYFKTWFQRLEQSQQAAERRYQAQIAAIQANTQNGQQVHVPQRRRTVPTRVEKRKNTRYLWLVDAMRKLAKKRENNAYKQAEAQRAAAQRKSQNDNNAPQRTGPQLTPLEFSKKRQERDLQMAEAARLHRQKMIEVQQRQLMNIRAQQQAAQGGMPGQQRPGSSSNAPQQHQQMQVNGQTPVNMNGQLPQQARPPLPMATRNGHLAVPQVNAQGIPQAQMHPNQAQRPQDLSRMAQLNRSQQYTAQAQSYQQMPNGAMPSPGGMTHQQQIQQNAAILQQINAQQQQGHNSSQAQGTSHQGNHQMSASPSMPPPPAPHNLQQQQQQPGQLSSGHVPALMLIKNELRSKHPGLSESQLNTAATNALREQSQNQVSTQARQNAMNAAAGIAPTSHQGNMQQAYGHNHAAFQNNAQMPNGNATYANGDHGAAQSPNMNRPTSSPQAAAQYANQLRARQMQMMQQQSPNGGHAQLNGSPGMMHASPNMTPASPSMAYSGMAGQVPNTGGRPPSRSNTPAMQRISSSGSVPGVNMGNGMQSPGALPSQGSPRNMQANMAR